MDIRNRFVGRWSFVQGLLLLMACFILQCELSDPESFNSWTFSGYVIDGHTGMAIEGATVAYVKDNSDEKTVKSGSNGTFLIDGLPYGERSFRFSYEGKDSTERYTERSVITSCWREASSSVDGLAGDVSQVIRLFPLTGALSGTLMIKMHQSEKIVPVERSPIRIAFEDTAMTGAKPAVFTATTDDDGSFSFEGLPLASGLIVSTPEYTFKGISYLLLAPSSIELFPDTTISIGNLYMKTSDSTDRYMDSIKSNVISNDGFGKTNVPVDITPYYLLPVTPDSASIQATITGGGDPKAIVRIHDDTVFVDPVRNLAYDSPVTIRIRGVDRDGNRIELTFDSVKQFTTEQGVFAVASNTWDASGQPVSNFQLYDTMWVSFSQRLDTSLGILQWLESDADVDVFGSGERTNAVIWISDDTLFVKPDLRLAVDYGKTIGFKVIVTAEDGKQSDSTDFTAKLVESLYYVKWSNTKDQLGNPRNDFGVGDSIVIVSNVAIDEVTAISEITDLTPPTDMTIDNLRIAGDTIIYKPSLHLSLNTTYGMDFNVTFANGIKRSDILPVTWTTRTGVMVLSTNNRQSGNFRVFKAFGDSLEVIFSKPIDTSDHAAIRFKVHMQSVKGTMVQTNVEWDSTRTRALIRPVDTLPTADFDASPAYTIDAVNTRAVDSITFDLSTEDGEQVFQLGVPGERIELHSEKGLCVTNTNILSHHDFLSAVTSEESPVDSFAVDGTIEITFNRAIDTARMNAFDLSSFCGIEKKENGQHVSCTVKFGEQNRVIEITPVSPLNVGKEYFLWCKNIPGYAIAGASAINDHGGTFSGKGSGGRLLDKAFITAAPDIRDLSVTIHPDTNSIPSVLDDRLGASAGLTYSAVVDAKNIVTASSMKFLIVEAAWNENHDDSVTGYQVQVQKVDRKNTGSGWYDLTSTIASMPYPSSNQDKLQHQKAEVDLSTASFYTSLLTQDGDNTGSFFLNSTHIFNDSSRIQIRIRPYVGSGDPLRNEVGVWSSPLPFTDNVAPCDSDFVTSSYCNTLSKGGVQITENISFDNSGGSATTDTGYIEITFPEDMDANGPAPAISFFYGPMEGTNPSESLSAVAENSGKSGWISARKYRFYISVPVFDYTHGSGDLGAFYNVSVAGCKDVSGNVIQSYGSNGSKANGDIEADDRPARTAAATDQVQGSESVVAGFTRCD